MIEKSLTDLQIFLEQKRISLEKYEKVDSSKKDACKMVVQRASQDTDDAVRFADVTLIDIGCSDLEKIFRKIHGRWRLPDVGIYYARTLKTIGHITVIS